MLAVVGISIAIAAVAFHSLQDKYDEFVHYFFNTLNHQEQIAVLALIFAVIFAAVGISGILNGGANSKDDTAEDETGQGPSTFDKKKKQSIRYPLHEMNQALSDRAKFACIFPWLRDTILDEMKRDNDMRDPALQDYLMRMMDYTIQGGKYNRGTTVINVYRVLCKRTLTPQEIAQAATLGWTIELLQAFFLVADDVMDESESRRDKPCWYQVDDVQLQAINDAFLLESFVFTIVKQHFAHLPSYTTILELLLDVIQKTELGQLLDLTIKQQQQKDGGGEDDIIVDFDNFTLERYALIVRYKTAYYSFYLPVALAMSLAGIKDTVTYQLTKQICGIMGEYFQVQDDIMDCFGGGGGGSRNKGEEIVGTDIQDNKCTWLIVQALHQANEEQRDILQANYGKENEDNVHKVKQVYKDLKLEQLFQKYQEDSYTEIQQLISQIKTVPKNVFDILLKKVYKRSTKK